MFKSRKLFIALIYGFALMLIAAACGGTSDTAVEGANEPTTIVAAPAETAPPTTPAPVVEDDHEDDADDEDGDGHDEDDNGHDEGDDDGHDDDDEGHDDDDDGTTADRVIEVTMDDFTFSPDAFEVTAGETISFVITNVGVVEHEFRLSNEHRIEEHMADGHSDDDHGNDDGHHEDGDLFLHLEAGESGEMTVTFPMDMTVFTEVACLIPGHYEAGMAAGLDYHT